MLFSGSSGLLSRLVLQVFGEKNVVDIVVAVVFLLTTAIGSPNTVDNKLGVYKSASETTRCEGFKAARKMKQAREGHDVSSNRKLRSSIVHSKFERSEGTYFVVDLVVYRGQAHILLEDIALAVQLDGLSPVVKGAGDEDLVGVIWPMRSQQSKRAPFRIVSIYHRKV